MKRLVFSALLVTCGLIAQAQQSAEWRPNLAEDNKAATWDDTSTFLVNKLAAAHWELDDHTQRSTVEVSSPQKCELAIHERYQWVKSYALPVDVRFTYTLSAVDLAHVDPLSIRVVPWGSDASRVFLEFEGTAGGPISKTVQFTGRFKKGVEPGTGSLDECKASSKECVLSTSTPDKFRIGYFDVETAHRLARALMHASLLCGGTKAVSPF